MGKRLDEASGRRLDELADGINQLLDPDGSPKEGKREELEAKIAEYEELLARKVGGPSARLDTLQKAVPVVAEILRSRPILEVPLDPPDADAEADHSHHDHDHHDHHHHDHAHPSREEGDE
jgi:ABC-type nickel/cobalt efflux system permease component RcnA